MTDSVEQNLGKTLEKPKKRADAREVEPDLVDDARLAESLSEKLQVQLERAFYRKKIKEQQQALDETYLVREEEREKSKELADLLANELWKLSETLGGWKQLEEEHEALKVQHDETLAKLAQAEEDLSEIRQGRVKIVPSDATSPEQSHALASSNLPHEALESEELLLQEEFDESETPEEVKQPTLEETPVRKEAVPPADEPTVEGASPAAVLKEDQEKPVLNLIELETSVLMKIFGFLDPLDILNTAQVNVSMYSRVDSLFGLGAQDEPDAEQNDNNKAPLVEPLEDTMPPAAEPPGPTMVQLPPAPAPTTVVVPPTPTPASAPSSTPTSPASAPLEGARGLLSLLQPRKMPKQSPKRFNLRSRSNSTASNSSNAPPMNSAMANSMAAKLTDAELNAIIVMTERLKQHESTAEQLRKENDALRAELDGTESVKQFLIARVREMESAMNHSEDNEVKIAQQIASDQEVIAFLDGKVQDLDRALDNLKKAKKEVEDELKSYQEQYEKKAVVMGDMLQFEREKLAESEREWKTTKKLLVKEVKNCRAQIVALQAERDGYREQNDRLRRRILSHGMGGSRDTVPAHAS